MYVRVASTKNGAGKTGEDVEGLDQDPCLRVLCPRLQVASHRYTTRKNTKYTLTALLL